MAAKLGGEPPDPRGERGVADGEPLGAHDHEFVEGVGAGQPLVDQILRLQRLRVRGHAAVAGQRARKQAARQHDAENRQSPQIASTRFGWAVA